MDKDLFPIQTLNLIAVLTLILICAILALISLWIAPKIRIWREQFAIRRRDRRSRRVPISYPDHLARLRLEPDAASRYGMTPTFRRNKPLHCLGCGASFDTLTDAVVHICPPKVSP